MRHATKTVKSVRARRKPRFLTKHDAKPSAGYHDAGLTARAFTNAQRRDLKQLGISKQRVEHLAGEVALSKSAQCLPSVRGADLGKTVRDVHEALARARQRLAIAHPEIRHAIDRAVRGSRLPFGSDDRALRELERPLGELELAVEWVLVSLRARVRPGRPFNARVHVLYAGVWDLLPDAIKATPPALREVLGICFSAAGYKRDELDRYIVRRRKQGQRAKDK